MDDRNRFDRDNRVGLRLAENVARGIRYRTLPVHRSTRHFPAHNAAPEWGSGSCPHVSPDDGHSANLGPNLKREGSELRGGDLTLDRQSPFCNEEVKYTSIPLDKLEIAIGMAEHAD